MPLTSERGDLVEGQRSTITWDQIQESSASKVVTWIVSAIPPIIFALYVAQFGVNVPLVDEWLRVPLVSSALDGHLSLSAVWQQFFEYRLPLPNLIFIADGYLAHFNSRSLMFFDAVIFTMGYYGMLVGYRRFSGARLNPINVLILGSVWFSLADVQNALWGFAVPWYVTVTSFVLMVLALTGTGNHPRPWFAIAAVLAICASYSMIQGFLLWPMGLICLLWAGPWSRAKAIRSGVWLGMGAITAIVYSIGFDFGNVGCGGYCSDTFAFSHPGPSLHALTVLVGNILPTGFFQDTFHPELSTGWQEVTGIFMLIAAGLVVFLSLRERRLSQRPPLPLLLIVFGFLWDLMIIDGRASLGVIFMVNNNRYEMPNLLILLGIVMFTLAHLPSFHRPTEGSPRTWAMGWVATVIVFSFLFAQVWISTSFAIENGRLSRFVQNASARAVVNLDRIPAAERSCVLYYTVWQGVFTTPEGALSYSAPIFSDMRRLHLGLFEPGSYAQFRAAGPPFIQPNCKRAGSAGAG